MESVKVLQIERELVNFYLKKMLSATRIIKLLEWRMITCKLPFTKLVNQHDWYSFRNYPFTNLVIQNMPEINPTFCVQGAFNENECLILKNCDTMFMSNWITRQNFPNTRDIFILGRNCTTPDVFHRFPATTRFFLTDEYGHYWNSKKSMSHVQVMTEEERRDIETFTYKSDEEHDKQSKL
jgi:hypothetical protein